MTVGGWLMMAFAWGSILALTTWCMRRVLKDPGEDE